MRSLETKIQQIKDALEKALEAIESPQELIHELREKKIIGEADAERIGRSALHADTALEDFIYNFEDLTVEISEKVKEADAAQLRTDEQEMSSAQTYTPAKKGGNGNPFQPN